MPQLDELCPQHIALPSAPARRRRTPLLLALAALLAFAAAAALSGCWSPPREAVEAQAALEKHAHGRALKTAAIIAKVRPEAARTMLADDLARDTQAEQTLLRAMGAALAVTPVFDDAALATVLQVIAALKEGN